MDITFRSGLIHLAVKRTVDTSPTIIAPFFNTGMIYSNAMSAGMVFTLLLWIEYKLSLSNG